MEKVAIAPENLIPKFGSKKGLYNILKYQGKNFIY